MPPLLSCQALSKSYGPRTLFENINLTFEDNERLGLIGPNGAGKSTLMKILAGVEDPDEGARIVSQGVRLGYVPQVETFDPEQTVEDVLVAALQDEPMEPFERTTEAAIMLGRFGFANPDQKVGTLSGGWKKRLSMARVIVRKPTLLLMDEPTNHLDIQGIFWLEDYLRNASFAYILVTHDRYFLENVTKRVIELNRRYPEGYLSVPGNYSEFLDRREAFFDAQSQRESALSNRVRREVEWLRSGVKARTRKSQARKDEAGRLIDELKTLKNHTGDDRKADLAFSTTRRRTKNLIVAENLACTLGGKKLFQDVSFILSPKDRLGLLGRNGTGKSTLLQLLNGAREPDAGEVKLATDLKMVTFDQNREQLDPDMTLRQSLAPHGDSVVFRDESVHTVTWAKRFLFRPDQLDSRIGDLSGGEQARVLIARLMLEPADVLLLDEPTNDLDIPTLEVLEDSLENFPGAIVLISHDRYLLDRVSTGLLGLDGLGNATFYADVSQWHQAQLAAEKSKGGKKESATKPVSEKPKKLTYKEQLEWAGMEQAILAAEEQLAFWEAELENPAHATEADKLQECARECEAAKHEVDSLYTRWAELEAKVS